ncbi:Ger(x)C family spore germination protein [Bacillus sp. UMB0899]|nr:Ger(x)C family spore germination protein [Bacillus sp. UMB0899]
MKKLIISLLIISTLTGCSNYRDLNEVALIIAVGIDKPVEQEKGYRVTFQVVNPSSFSTNSGSNAGLPQINYTIEGDTLFDAYRKSSSIIPRENVASHLSLVIISEELAKEGIYTIFDLFERGKQTRPNMPIYIARETSAEHILSLIEPVESNPSKSIISTSENNKEMYGIAEAIPMFEVIDMLSSEGKDLMLTGIRHSNDNDTTGASENLQKINPSVMEVDGIAVFEKDRLVQWLNGKLARTARLILSQVKSTAFPLTCGNNREEKLITITTRHNKTHLSTEVKNGQILLNVRMSLKGEISEASCHLNFTDPNTLKDLEERLVKDVRSQIQEVFDMTQKQGTDIFGFGEKLSRSNPAYWKKHKHEWNDLFSKAKLSVKIEASIETTGMRVDPYNFN